MRNLRRLAAAALAAWLAMAAGAVAQPRFATPEEAVTAYIEGVIARDYKAVYAATAIDAMSKGFDFVSYVERLRALTPQAPAPGGDPFFVAINRATIAAGIARQLQTLVYGLTTDSPVVEGKMVAPVEVPEAQAFVAAADPARLGGLELVKIGVPNPTQLNSERAVANFTRQAAIYGADEITERIALVAFEGRHYMIGFGIIRFGDNWLVERQVSHMAGTPAIGAPTRITPEHFEAALQ